MLRDGSNWKGNALWSRQRLAEMKTYLPFDPEIYLLGLYLRETHPRAQGDRYMVVHCSVFVTADKMERPSAC